MEYVDGNERRFGAEDLFFSTTDTKGVIRRTNRVFDSLSRYSPEELVGSPHNIIRHDDMPAGAFKLMWDELEQGRSSCVYVLNRAKDGRDYWVFATIAPLADGYLSVRVRPTNHAMFTPVKEIYARVRAAERAYAEEGHGRREVAEHGAALLTEELAKLQYHDLHNFARAALPRELALLVVEGVRVPPRAESDNPMSAVLQAVARHTCGAEDMSGLDMVVFIADMIEPGRTYPHVQALRDAVGTVSLDELFFQAYASTLRYLIGAGMVVYPDSLSVYNALALKRACAEKSA